MGEIRVFSFSFAPKGWALCNGQFLPINQNQALFSLLGTFYGGNGQTTFALPNLQGRMGVHSGRSELGDLSTGQAGGEIAHVLTSAEMPRHSHPVSTVAKATTTIPTGALVAGSGKQAYSQQADTSLHPATVSRVGGSQPHNNRSPYLTVSFCIALQGIFPSRD